MKHLSLWIGIVVVISVGCANQQVKDLLTPGSEINKSFAAGAPQSPSGSPDSSSWTETRTVATTHAKSTGKVILANFTGSDWCPPCKKLEEEIFSTEEFKNWACINVVLLRLDFPKKSQQSPGIRAQNQQLAQIYSEHISGYPTVLFLDASGQVLGKLGYVQGGPEAWIGAANQQLGKARP